MNWLLAQCRTIGDGRQQAENIINEQTGILQKNNEILNGFLEENDLVMDWQGYLAKLEQEAQEEKDAVQESSTTQVDAQEQAEDGEELGKGDA